MEGTLVIDEKYSEEPRDIRAGQSIFVIFVLHRSPGFSPAFLRQRSGHHGTEASVLSTCSPIRFNPIGMSVLEVLGIRDANIDVGRLGMFDNTPILDIKPCIKTGFDKRFVSQLDLELPYAATRSSRLVNWPAYAPMRAGLCRICKRISESLHFTRLMNSVG